MYRWYGCVKSALWVGVHGPGGKKPRVVLKKINTTCVVIVGLGVLHINSYPIGEVKKKGGWIGRSFLCGIQIQELSALTTLVFKY